MRPLTGLKVLDLTQRLPGPLAGMLLAQLGAEVIKLEDRGYKDAFLDDSMLAVDPTFAHWYQQLNREKNIIRHDFADPNVVEIEQLLAQTDIILHGIPDKIANHLGLSFAALEKRPEAFVVLQIAASKNKSYMHDLNALAGSGLLKLHLAQAVTPLMAPPFLPVAGISFGQQIALTALALHRQAQQLKKPVISKLFLDEEMLKVCSPFSPQSGTGEIPIKSLHNGKFPCYCLYRTKDGDWVAVAAVEERFWRELIELLGLKLQPSDRFSTEAQVFQQLSSSIEARTSAELAALIDQRDICVSLIRINS